MNDTAPGPELATAQEQAANQTFLTKHGIDLKSVRASWLESRRSMVGGFLSLGKDIRQTSNTEQDIEWGNFLGDKYNKFFQDKYGRKLSVSLTGVDENGIGQGWAMYDGSYNMGRIRIDPNSALVELTSPNPSSPEFRGSGARQAKVLSEFSSKAFGVTPAQK